MNMCATRMSLALHEAGAGKIFSNWSKDIVHDSQGRKLIASVEYLMELLEQRLGQPIPLSKQDARDFRHSPVLVETQGIIAFKNYWQRSQNDAFTGDHITLWDGSTTADGGENTPQIYFWPLSRLSNFISRQA